MSTGALLRLAAVPMRTWLAGGSPEAFDRLRLLAGQVEAHRSASRELAGDIGTRLVPHPDLDAAGRARALTVRRALHRGGGPPPASAAVADLADILVPDLGVRLRELIRSAAALDRRRSEVERFVLAEDERLMADAWRLLHDTPFGRAAAGDGDVTVHRDIAARVAAGEPWTSKRMRRRADYLWRILTRAATRATPRGWLAHVAVVPVGGGWDGTGPLPVLDRVAAQYAPNLDTERAVRVGSGLADDASAVALAPLHRLADGQLLVWRLTGADRTDLDEVRLRRTPLLEQVVAGLAGGPVPVGRLLDGTAGPDPDRRAAVRGLLAHLVSGSVLQVAGSGRPVLTGWRPGRSVAAAARPDGGYVDVYRPAGTGLSTRYAGRLATLARLAMRLMALIETDGPPGPGPVPAALTDRPRPLLDVARSFLAGPPDPAAGRPHRHDWPPATRPGSPYAGLMAWLAVRAEAPDGIDLDEATLDALGAPDPVLDWPVDCLLHPRPGLGGPVAVLEQVAPAGILDARFVPALTALTGPLPQVEWYRGFLARRAAAAGARPVEVLAPPLSVRAANAVRRPAYTAAWTGDPDRAGYLDGDGLSYLPLSRITLRRDGASVVAEAGGERIWPVRHTARVAAPPWSTVVDLLMLASPQPERTRWRALRYSLTGWPERAFMPRITVGGALVVTPAQWRIPAGSLWRADDRLVDRYAALERLRRRHRLPRVVQVATDPHAEPLTVDLVSPHGLRALDRIVQRGADTVLVRELPADPDRLPVHDEATGAGCVAELLLRLAPAIETSGNGAGSVTRQPAR